MQNVFAKPWGFLRFPVEVAQIINPIVVWLVIIFSSIILLIAFLSFRKKNSKRLLLVFIAFSFIFFQSFLNLIDFYFSPGVFMNPAVQGVFDLIIISALFIALFKK